MCNAFGILDQKSGMGVACKALLQLQTEPSTAPALELEDTDRSAVDLPIDRDVGCLQPVFKRRKLQRCSGFQTTGGALQDKLL